VAAKEGSIKAASEKLHLSQPTVSVQIKALEEEIGFDVFIREHKKLTLSQKGLVLLSHAESLFRLADDLVAELPKMGNQKKENFRVGTLHSLSSVFINDFSIDLWKDSLVSATISQGSKEALMKGLDCSEFDFVLSDESCEQTERYNSINLGRDRLVAVASSGFEGYIQHFPNSLNALPYISYLNHGRTQSEISYYFKRNSIFPDLVGRVDDMALMRRIIVKGICFGVMPYRAIKDSLDNGELIQLGEFKDIQFNLWGIFPAISSNRKIIKKIISDYFRPEH